VKTIVVALSFAVACIAISSAFNAAYADRMNGRGNCVGGICTKVTCPPKTCSRGGTSEAYDLKYCSAANCRK
jgi:hypothetical protein